MAAGTEAALLACVIVTRCARKYGGKVQTEPAEEVTGKKSPQNVWGRGFTNFLDSMALPAGISLVRGSKPHG